MPQCRNSSSGTLLTWPSIAGATLGLLSVLAMATEVIPNIDTRQAYSTGAPQWLRAVGKLTVPGSTYHNGHRSHLTEDCSATLVSEFPGRKADTIVTAWHCLENYDDLSRPILFTLLWGETGALEREAYLLADGGSMAADWALLRLREPVAAREIAALPIHPTRADAGQPVTMAGYSRDKGLGEFGDRLTFDPACLITSQVGGISSSDCRAYKGASGGAVVQLSAAGAPQFSGVISEGDGAGISTFVPVDAFRSAIKPHLD